MKLLMIIVTFYGTCGIAFFYSLSKFANSKVVKDGKKIRKTSIIRSGFVDMVPENPSKDPTVESLPYLFCGDTDVSHHVEKYEILLLHGKKFTKETWKDSHILQYLCKKNTANNRISAVAIDLSVQSNGLRLQDAFMALTYEGILSGKPIFLVTPSASGKTAVGLGKYVADKKNEKEMEENNRHKYLSKIVRAWIPVACGSALKATEDALNAFNQTGIPVLAINGNEDKLGVQVTQRLVATTGARAVEINGGHSCYLDSPHDFTSVLLHFIQKTP